MHLNHESRHADMLVCPTTKLPLELASRGEAESRMGGPLQCRRDQPNAKGGLSRAVGVTDTVLIREDLKCAYPVLEGIPVLLAPELLTAGLPPSFDLCEPRYAEAYEEMEFYNSSAAGTMSKLDHGGAWSILPTEMAATDEEKRSFPAPWQRWIDTPHDSAALWDAYVHLGKMDGKKVLQLGGSGTHVMKFAMVGAAQTWLVTPMVSEASFARALADSAGVGDRFRCVVAIAEELPFPQEMFDGIFAGGCLHHMLTEIALPEAARILRTGGRFAAIEPWRAPLYAIGTRILGKREHAYCRPLDGDRLRPMNRSFHSVSLVQHGTITRYPFLALSKFGVNVDKKLPWYFGKADDAVCSLVPGLRRMGSSIAVLGTK